MAEGSSHYIQNQIFSPNVIKGIYDVIAPKYPDSLKIQQAFFPDENYTTDEAIAYFRHNFSSRWPYESGRQCVDVFVSPQQSRFLECAVYGDVFYARDRGKIIAHDPVNSQESAYQALQRRRDA